MKKRFIAFKIIAPIICVLTVVGVTLITVPGRIVRKQWLANELKTIATDKNVVDDDLKQELANTSSIAKEIADTYGNVYRTDVNNYMVNLLCKTAVEDMGVEEIAFYDVNKNKYSPDQYSANGHFTSSTQRALNGTAVSEFRIEGPYLIAVSTVPVFSDGKVVACVEVGNNLTSEDFMNRLSSTTGCEFTVINGDERIQTTIEGMQNTKISAEVYETLKKGDFWTGETSINGTTYVAYYWPSNSVTGLSLFVGKDASSMDMATKSISGLITMMEVVCNVSILILCILLVTFIIIRPIKQTKAAIDSLSTGDADLTQRIPVKSTDEIGQLSAGVNKFIELLQGMMKTITEKSGKVSDVISDLGASAQETASACTEIMANIESVKNQSANQTNAVSSTTDVIGKSGEYLGKLNENITAQSSDITESSAAIEEMVGNINAVSDSANKMTASFADLTKVISEGSSNVKACSEIIKQIEEKSNGLADANNTIKAISSQTNLLAMNAMIESAHAGEAGKGFAVVADEIRKLAENSSNQAGSIEDNIREIVALITEGGRLSNLSEKSFQSIDNQVSIVDPLVRQITGAMEEQTTGSSQILDSLSNMKEESVTVDDSCRQLSGGFDQIKSNMESVAMVSNTILGSMDEMAAGSQQISKATQNVSDLALNTKEAVEGINALIGKFKV